MGGLRDINFAVSYRSDEGNIVDQFYVPCLKRASVYRRAVGYFTSSGLSAAAKGLAQFLKSDGKMFLVASPKLNKEDCDAIEKGYESRNEVVARAVLRELDGEFDQLVNNRLACLAWLIAAGRLEIKLAVPGSLPDGRRRRGLYHEKIGIFTDAVGNQVAFTGSSNESSGGLIDNFESVDVYWSWDDPQGRVAAKERQFDDLWRGRTKTLEVVEFTDAMRRKLVSFTKDQPPLEDPEGDQCESDGAVPPAEGDLAAVIRPRPYQADAIRVWLSAGGRGILAMATGTGTGTGKTKTAMFALDAVSQERAALAVIVAPYKHLTEQWASECGVFTTRYQICSSDQPSWEQDASGIRLALAARSVCRAALITTYDTFATLRFQQLLQRFPQPKVFISDEVHHLGARSRRLDPGAFDWRLGLSATPERAHDPEGTAWLLANVGPIVYRFPIEKAIPNFLCPYDYFLHIVRFTPDEQAEYQELMTQIALACARGGGLEEEDPEANSGIGPLLRKRLDLIGGAENKIPALMNLVAALQAGAPDALNYSLFYASSRLFDQIMFRLSSEHQLRVSRFTFEESRKEREEILDNFSEGRIQAILAKKCLDEGLDIPATRTAFILASSSNPMEFTQRRGRVLRPFPGKDYAVVHDFFVAPPEGTPPTECDRRLVERELRRAIEFAATSRNPVHSRDQMIRLQRQYNLLHL